MIEIRKESLNFLFVTLNLMYYQAFHVLLVLLPVKLNVEPMLRFNYRLPKSLFRVMSKKGGWK